MTEYVIVKYLILLHLLIFSSRIESIITDRDIILSPDRSLNQPGKVIYYVPNNESKPPDPNLSNIVPWEEALKHTIFLTLRNNEKYNDDSSQNIFENNEQNSSKLYRAIINARYINLNNNEPSKFGDIITLARGKLEIDRNGHFNLIQTNSFKCDKLCFDDFIETEDNITAIWMVEKIRHRDEALGHRFEMRITVLPAHAQRHERTAKGINFNNNNNGKGKTFILRENDYPKYFTTTQSNYRKSQIDRSFFDFGDMFSHKQEIPFDLNYHPELNAGEFYMRPPTRLPQNYVFSSSPRFPHQMYPSQLNLYENTQPNKYTFQETTNHLRFPDNQNTQINQKYPDLTTSNLEQKPVLATHYHHHYYVNKNKIPIPIVQKTPIYDKESTLRGDYNKYVDDYKNSIAPPVTPRNPFRYEQNPYKQNIQNHYHESKKPQIENELQTPQIFTDQIQIPPQSSNYHQNLPQITSQNYPAPVISLNHNNNNDYNQHHHVKLYQQQYQHPHLQIQQQPVTTAQYAQPLQVPPPQYTQQYPLNSAPNPNSYNIEHTSPKIQKQNAFHESEQIELHKYSDPDPLYHPQAYNSDIKSLHNADSHTQQEHEYHTNTPELPTQTESTPIEYHEQQNQEPENHQYRRVKPKRYKNPSKFRNHNTDHVSLKIREPSSTHIPDTQYPDSINAQLPPPEQGTDTNVPYVETSIVTQKSTSPLLIVPEASRQPDEEDNPISSSSSNTNSADSHPPITHTQRIKTKLRSNSRHTLRTTTEKPILKWMPKRRRNNNQNYSSLNNTTSTRASPTKLYSSKIPHFDSKKVENYITVTPIPASSSSEPENMESETRKSFSTSISVEVGNKRRKLFEGLRPRLKTPIGNKYEMIKADIQSLQTNSTDMQLYRASDEISESRHDDLNTDPIAMSIINHAKSITRKNDSQKLPIK